MDGASYIVSDIPYHVVFRVLSHVVEELGSISSQFTIGFGSFVDKVAYPYASTLQNGSDYLEFHLGNMRFVILDCY